MTIQIDEILKTLPDQIKDKPQEAVLAGIKVLIFRFLHDLNGFCSTLYIDLYMFQKEVQSLEEDAPASNQLADDQLQRLREIHTKLAQSMKVVDDYITQVEKTVHTWLDWSVI